MYKRFLTNFARLKNTTSISNLKNISLFLNLKKDSVSFEKEIKKENHHSTKLSEFSDSDSNSFDKFNIPQELLIRLNKLGFKKPFEIQDATLTHTLAGKDVIGKSFTGSGKTLAFAIPIITKILKSEKISKFPKCLILSPTRELCLQLTKTIEELIPNKIKCLAIYGGSDYRSQIIPLRNKVDIICATPGRLRDLMNRKNFITKDIEIICLDEADELLTPNFKDQINDVIDNCRKEQMMMFSATINNNVKYLIHKYMENPVFIDLTKNKQMKIPEKIQHFIVKCNYENNPQLIIHYLKEFKTDRCIVFMNTKRESNILCQILKSKQINAQDLHSDYSQAKRMSILEKFRNGGLNILIATDVAARGLDIPDVNLIIQIDAPNNGLEYYIHRSGRTGRAGKEGSSILIDNGNSFKTLREISRIVKFQKLYLPESIKMKNYENESTFLYNRHLIKRNNKFNI